MTAPTVEISTELQCHRCGYDLRAHPQGGKCPECGASVEEARRVAAIPRRPVWRDSDPRWRRRMLAGAWVLVLLPLMSAMQVFGWASRVPAPNIFGSAGAGRTLDETLVCFVGVYEPLVFCIGVVLLFSKERGRRRCRLDWTRRWGVVSSYIVFLLSAAQILFVAALLLVGITAVFHSMPLKYQPNVTKLFADVGSAYLRYGPQPMNNAGIVLVACSSIAILLASVSLFDALGSSGPKRLAVTLLAPLALFAVIHLVQAGRYYIGFSNMTPTDIFFLGEYFRPQLLASYVAGASTNWIVPGPAVHVAFVVEATKWCIVLGVAVWLSIAQLAASRQRKTASSIPAQENR